MQVRSSIGMKKPGGVVPIRKIQTAAPSTRKAQEQGMGDNDALLSPRAQAKQCAEVMQYEANFTKRLNQLGIVNDNAIRQVLSMNKVTDSVLRVKTPAKHFSMVFGLVIKHIAKNNSLLDDFSSRFIKQWLTTFKVE